MEGIKTFFTSDTHFDHHNIIAYTGRPFKTANEMDETIIKNWNETVGEYDNVYFLGDLTFHTKVMNYLSRLNGNIIWIKGNHDKKAIMTKAYITYGGREWELVHDPNDATSNNVLCGHKHEEWKVKKEGDRVFVNVGVDQHNFYPITIKTILKCIDDYDKENKTLK